jgi:hypothetical protein
LGYDKDHVRVGLSRNGIGVFSLQAFHAGQRIGPIEGTLMEDPDYESDYCMELGKDHALEPDAPFRFVNHSCHPNCSLVEIEIEYEDGTAGPSELWLEAEAEIEPGDEMTIDYAWPARSAIPCHCGSPDCRGWIVAAKELDDVVALAAATRASAH